MSNGTINGPNGVEDHETTGTFTNGNGIQEKRHINSVDSSRVPVPEPIAICGMSVRFPGGLNTPQQFWDFLVSKGNALGPVPESRYNASAYWSEAPKPGSIKTQYGYFLDESIDIASIDTSFFSMRKAEIERTDPQQRQMLEVARECLEDAGEFDWRGRPIGCYMGSFGEDWSEMSAKESQQYGLYRVTGYGDFMLPNRVSYELDLTGPSLVVRTACSSSLVALHEACLAVSRGDCEGAIVGGANLIMAPGMSQAITEQGVLAPDGSCKSFSAEANGYGRAEAISAVFIKPLRDAVRDGNPIRAVIRSTASNSNGKGIGLGFQVPNGIAQEIMIRQAYDIAGIDDYSQTAFVECHGTGTSVGDPIEARAVGRVFGPSGGVLIGSVKPNLGHSEGASGLTSLIKAVLALEHRTIPPNIKFNEPNPDIPWDLYRLAVPTESTPWPDSKQERVSVNSFGIGGTNAHVILDSARSFGISPAAKRPTISPQLLVFSATGAESLRQMISNYEDYIERNPERVSDLAFTLGHKREHLPHRAFAVASSLGALTISPLSKPGAGPNVVMVLTGQGAQWPRMGRAMIQSSQFSIFKQTIQSLDAHLQTLDDAPDWNVEQELLKPAKTSRLGSAELSQPLCTAIQIALVDTFASVGIHPTAVVGHSSGEVAAAYAAGAITAQEAITIAFYRGLVTKLQTKPGAMAAIALSSEEIQDYLTPGVVVACENSPRSITIAGDAEAVRHMVVKVIKESRPDVMARLLQVNMAYHSHHMIEISSEYHALIKDKISPRKPTKLFFSSVKGGLLSEASDFGPRYWQTNMESRVLFSPAISSIIGHNIAKNAVFLEVGPHSALAGPLRQIQTHHSSSCPYVSSLARHENDIESFLTAVGRLHSLNIAIDLTKVIARGSILADLPRYPWNHSEKYWYESRLSKEWRHRQYRHHDLLGVRVPESLDYNVLFRNLFHLDNAPWIRDHKVGTDIVFPFAGYAGMIGEAVRRATHVDEAFKLRNVVVSTALVLNDSKPVEIMTTLRRQRLTNALDSEWWEFTVASYSGTVWTKHCSGEARSYSESFGAATSDAPFLRKVDTHRCYDSMARSGLNFGPEFQRLNSIQADTLEQKADARVAAKERDNIDYHLHPTIIDASLQLLSVAASKGFANYTEKTMVPTQVDEICIYRPICSGDIRIRATASYTPSGSVNGSGQGVDAEGRLVLRSSGIKLSIVEGQSGGETGEPTAYAEWAPHIDFLDIQGLIKPSIDRSEHMPDLTTLSHLCMVHNKRILATLDTSIEHMHKYRSWISRHVAASDLTDLEALNNATIESRIGELVDNLTETPAAIAAIAIGKIFSNAAKIFTGEIDALDVLLSDDTLNKLYIWMDQCDESQFLKHLAHSKPNLRVLEIGAGTGGSTTQLLAHLTPSGRTMYSNYTFTDISSGFFVAAKERFKDFPNMHFATLDISKDPSEQGFESCTYDLILATNVIHATRSLNESLTNVRQLLSHDGRLLLHELTSTTKCTNYVCGTLAGWWYGGQDGRTDEPYISIQRWAKELQAAGFCAPDAAVMDSAQPYQLNSMIVSRPATKEIQKKYVTLLVMSETVSKSEAALRQRLESRGYIIHRARLHDLPMPAGQNIIALLDDDAPFFENLPEERFALFKAFTADLKDSGVLWITHLSQMQCQDPRFGQILGIARTLRSEMLLEFATCEVDHLESSLEKIIDVFERFQARQESDTLDPDYEYAIVGNTVHVGRFYPFSPQNNHMVSSPNDPIALRTSKPGRLSALYWACFEAATLKDDQVEVEVHAVGLNFKDVLCAMGIVQASDGFGLEGAGVVRHIGPDVKGLQLGDRVMFFGDSAFATKVVASERTCAKIPDDLSFSDAATMPTVFGTAYHSVFNIGNLEKDQSILIHSACGGVGIATIQLARMIGATVYATVSSEEKIKYLQDTFGLDRSCIFNSRNDSFVEQLMRQTNGKGVDLALNSLSGELLHATWKCIAPFGRMVEIGKRDLIGSGKLDMSVFEENRSYSCVDLYQLCLQKGDVAKKLLENVVDLYENRRIQPIRPIKVFGRHEILDSFKYMQQGVHLGKIVVSMRTTSSSSLEVKPRKEAVRFDSSGAYLLVGGLGGLGRSISTWMVQRGARHLIYLSRSAGASQKHQHLAKELDSLGCRIDFVQGTVISLDDVTTAVARANGRLKGVLQMSMVLSDQTFPKMTLDEWNTAVDPKVKGTWNLHNASLSSNADLDFFILFSSVSGIIGQPGQTNYAGANTFLDAFSQYRASLGLPACSIDIGTVDEVGYVAEHQPVKQRLKAAGLAEAIVSERELHDALGAAITNQSSNFCLGFRSNISLGGALNRSLWKKDIRMAVFHNTGNTASASGAVTNDELRTFIEKAKKDSSILSQSESAHFLAVEIGKKVFSFLVKPEEDLQTSCSLSDLGMDSLVAIEVRQWWKMVFQFDISVLEMMSMSTLDALGEHAAKGMLQKFHSQ